MILNDLRKSIAARKFLKAVILLLNVSTLATVSDPFGRVEPCGTMSCHSPEVAENPLVHDAPDTQKLTREVLAIFKVFY